MRPVFRRTVPLRTSTTTTCSPYTGFPFIRVPFFWQAGGGRLGSGRVSASRPGQGLPGAGRGQTAEWRLRACIAILASKPIGDIRETGDYVNKNSFPFIVHGFATQGKHVSRGPWRGLPRAGAACHGAIRADHTGRPGAGRRPLSFQVPTFCPAEARGQKPEQVADRDRSPVAAARRTFVAERTLTPAARSPRAGPARAGRRATAASLC